MHLSAAAIEPIVRFSSLIFVIFAIALSLILLLPKAKETRAYKNIVGAIRPILPYFGWLFFAVGATWSVWGFFQPGEIKLIIGLGVVLLVLGIHIVKIAYEDEADSTNATNLKVVSLSISFSLAFLFLLLYGSGIAQIFR